MLGAVEESGAEALAELGPGATAGFAAALVAVGLFALPLRQAILRRLLHKGEPAPAAFLWEDLFAAFGLFIVVSAFVVPSLGSYWVTGQWLPPEDLAEKLSSAGFLVQGVLTAIQFLPPCLYLAWLSARRSGVASALGIRALTPQRVPAGRSAAAFLSFLFGAPFFFSASLATAAVYQAQGLEVPVQEVAVAIADEIESSPWRVAIFAVLIIPFLEEVLFRGFLLELFRSKLGTIAGVAISSALFAIAHGVVAAPTIFVLAVVIAMVKLRTRSLYAAWLVHALNNGTSLVMQQLGMSE